MIERRQRASTLLLGGAQRRHARPRGFIEWSPRADTKVLLDQVQTVLDEYQEHLPLTIRQIFYRLVGAHGYEKTEHAYERLAEHLSNARRARIIPMEVIRDDGGTVLKPNSWDSGEQFLAAVRRQASLLMLDRSARQKTRLVVFCEAGGMVPQLARVANPLSITVMSSGGFESLTDKY
jgi:hypothetical protein